MTLSAKYWLTVGLRGTQLACSLGVLGLATLNFVQEVVHDQSNYFALAIAALSVVFLSVLFIPSMLARLPAAAVGTLESVLFVLWITASGKTADYWAYSPCDRNFDYLLDPAPFLKLNAICKRSKGILAMDVLNTLSFGVTFVMHILCVTLPLSRDTAYFRGGNLCSGGIFHKNTKHDEEID